MAEYTTNISWTNKEKNILKDNYFIVLRVFDTYWEIQSKNTGQLWLIKKSIINLGKVSLYHKHSSNTNYYHLQTHIGSVLEAISIIKAHDRYTLNLLYKN